MCYISIHCWFQSRLLKEDATLFLNDSKFGAQLGNDLSDYVFKLALAEVNEWYSDYFVKPYKLL